ncbi:primase homolog protein isoform X2 [Populus trichocarpa]|uniref:Toprim domain-containing protein n=1 Tax=Populus trichocarpa TaxID=3694 RepID=A0A3N7EMT2_POPTR|nr:primase homolog protein isoform X2 [Populus trichocarpa]|eukprot:XP_024455895.1 primase homolog protein isoform X2 [Populus trichocarpa]
MATSALSLTNQLCRFSSEVHFLFINKNFSTPKSTRLISHVWSYSKTTRIPALHSANGYIKEAIEEGEGMVDSDKVRVLKQKIEVLGIKCDDSCFPGQYYHLLCPKCKGGKTMERSLSFNITQDVDVAMWRCFGTSCGWTGQAFADSRMPIAGVNKIFKVKSSKQVTPENVVLEPLGDKYIIAFTYRQNGAIVGCKYRTMEKRFWQEKDTRKWLYGLDDINEATEIIIVEGEIDKLSVEEAGFRNCVSVPGGAPQIVSAKDLPSIQKDRAYQYLWNSKEYLDKLSRIVLATDGDTSGRSLAEELARRLGKERCWVVRWPEKDDSRCFKDANEVLKCLGPAALKGVIQTAEKYEACQLHRLN